MGIINGILRGNGIADFIRLGAIKAKATVTFAGRPPISACSQLTTFTSNSLVLHRVGIKDFGIPHWILLVSILMFPPMLTAQFDDIFKISTTHRFHVERWEAVKHRLALAA